jgi:5'-nucleotidase
MPDLVLSGVNDGDNLGEDVTYSGTIAATMEASLLGLKAIAFSQNTLDGRPTDWATAEAFGPDVVRHCLKLAWAPYTLFNVNFPACLPGEVTGIHAASQAIGAAPGLVAERMDLRNRPYYWFGHKQDDDRARTQPDSDIAVIARNGVAVTPLHLDLTHHGMMKSLQEILK